MLVLPIKPSGFCVYLTGTLSEMAKSKLVADLLQNWWLRHKTSPGTWLSLWLVSLPIALLLQVWTIQTTYLKPGFAALNPSTTVTQIVHQQGAYASPLAPYLLKEFQQRAPLTVIYEKMHWLKWSEAEQEHEVAASFISGGFSELGLKPVLGSFVAMEFPPADVQLNVAISHQFWRSHFKQRNVIGHTLMLNGKLAVIAAVMPAGFASFRSEQNADVVVPFSFLALLGLADGDQLSPDVFSYLLHNSPLPQQLAQLETELKNEALLFDDESFTTSAAFGMSVKQFETIKARLELLSQLFIGLMLFSLLAFTSHIASASDKRLNEMSLRKMLGATPAQLGYQRHLEMLISVSLVLVFSLLLFWPCARLLTLMLPDIPVVQFELSAAKLSLLMQLLFYVSLAISLILYAQHRWTQHSLGRGATVSKAEKVQTYVLLAALFVLSSGALTYSSQLLLKQWHYSQLDRGYNSEQLSIVTFDFPKFGGTYYVNKLPSLLITNLTATAEIQQAALTSTPVLLPAASYVTFYTSTGTALTGRNNAQVLTNHISPDYFKLMGIELLQGESLNWDNYWQVVISESLWHQHFKDIPLSQAQITQTMDDGERRAIQVVGVAKDVHRVNPDDPVTPTVYRITPTITGQEYIVIKSDTPAERLQQLVQQELSRLDTTLQNPKVVSATELISRQQAPQLALLSTSLVLTLVVLLSSLLFCLNAVALLTRKSARELALRLTLGARPRKLVLNELLTLSVIYLPLVFCITLALPELFAQLGTVTGNLGIYLLFTGFNFAFLFFTLMVLYLLVRKIKHHSWHYLQ
jgi:hypothetical protein